MIGHQLSFDKRNLRPKFGYLSPTGQNRQAKRGRFDRPCFTGLYKPPQNRTPLFKHNGDLVNHPLRIVEARQAAIHARLCLAPESPVLIAHPPRRSKSPCPGGDRLPCPGGSISSRPGGGRSSRPGGGNAAVQSTFINPRHATTPLSPAHSSATEEGIGRGIRLHQLAQRLHLPSTRHASKDYRTFSAKLYQKESVRGSALLRADPDEVERVRNRDGKPAAREAGRAAR